MMPVQFLRDGDFGCGQMQGKGKRLDLELNQMCTLFTILDDINHAWMPTLMVALYATFYRARDF